MKRLLWWIGGNVVVLAILVGAAWLWVRPASLGPLNPDRTVTAFVGPQYVTVSYRPGQSEFLVSVRIDGLGKYREVEYNVLSSESWAPQWQARMEGKLSEFITLYDGHDNSPEPMTKELAEQLARSYKVTLRMEGEERKFDFVTADVSESTPLFVIRR